MDINKIKKVHIVGIGGIGVSAVARIFLNLNKKVSGSDLYDSALLATLRNFGVEIFIGPHLAKNITKDTDLVVFSDAVPEDNLERQEAKKLKILQMSYFEFLGEFSRNIRTIAISGCHGKTTTTAITGLIFEKARLNPTVIVGSKVKDWDGNYRQGGGKLFIVEGDEYRAHMLNLNPQSIILTNIEADHLDFYRDINHIVETFNDYVEKLPGDGLLVLNADDPMTRDRLERPSCQIVTYGIENQNADLVAKNIKIENGRQIFRIVYRGQDMRDFNIQIPGRFNIYNALAAVLVALENKIDPKIIKETLAQYKGSWRRFELVGTIAPLEIEKKGAMVISDYAHHPTEVAATIKAAREFYPDRNLIVAFQPHHRNRTKKLFNEFISALTNCPANTVILNEIYDVPGREIKADEQVSSHDLVEKINLELSNKIAKGEKTEKQYFFTPNLAETKKEILKNLKGNDIVLIMGAGEIDNLAREIVKD